MGALDGFTIVDCTLGLPGPMATGMLADHGADVIRVEPPQGAPRHPGSPVHNRGKRSIVLDLRSDEGQVDLHTILASADALVMGRAPDAAEKLGLGWETLHSRHPHLVVCAITGYGADSPDLHRPGHEPLVLARLGGLNVQAGHREGPIYPGVPMAGHGAAFLAVIGTLAALYRRSSDGLGRYVDTSLYDGALAGLGMQWHWAERQLPRLEAMPPELRMLVAAYECADGEWLDLHTAATGAHGRLMRLLGLDDRVSPAKGTVEAAEPMSREEGELVLREVPRILATQPRAYWIEKLLEADIAVAPVLRPGEVFDHPQVRHEELVVRVDDPDLGPVEQVGVVGKLAETPGGVRFPAAALGTHTHRVLNEARSADPRPAPTGPPDLRPLLADVRILDMGQYYAGPYAHRLLGDLGADVIKLEPLAGDPLRSPAMERSFLSAQRGKRSIALDLKDPTGLEVAQRLFAWADVIAHNMRPGVTERLGLGPADAARINPQAVYLHAPGWGSTGPSAGWQSFAPLMSALCGLHYEASGEGNPPALRTPRSTPLMPVNNEDYANAFAGAATALMALLARHRLGHGQYVECSQLAATLTLGINVQRLADGTVIGRNNLDAAQQGIHATVRLYRTADGWICVVAGFAVEGLCRALDVPFGTPEEELVPALERSFAALTTVEADARLTDAGVRHEVVVEDGETRFFTDDRQLKIGRVAEYDHPVHGVMREIAHLIRVSDAEPAPDRRAPLLGEHTDEILAMLGYSEAEVAAMHERRVVRRP
jgi:crotonobetainyl-CoA:carnitine CoA-transferase CaiB-like acyl-CoA transferase